MFEITFWLSPRMGGVVKTKVSLDEDDAREAIQKAKELLEIKNYIRATAKLLPPYTDPWAH
ncbi:MAG: hypothetical protein ACOZAL_03600 [Patescibacteria group bacterium]